MDMVRLRAFVMDVDRAPCVNAMSLLVLCAVSVETGDKYYYRYYYGCGYRAWGVQKSVLSNRGLGIKAKKCLYEGVIVPTALYGTKAWSMRSTERRKVNVLEMQCWRSWVGVSRMD